ncbi:MAG: hypothetical protein V4469_04925 [Patescibacteria group bacterium]
MSEDEIDKLVQMLSAGDLNISCPECLRQKLREKFTSLSHREIGIEEKNDQPKQYWWARGWGSEGGLQ